MTQTYKVDKVVCLKHITAEQGSSISYRSKTIEARAAQAKCRQKSRMHFDPDKESEYGPPDKATNFNNPHKRQSSTNKFYSTPSSKKGCIEIDNKKIQFVPNPHPEVIGKQVRMKFEIVDSNTFEWFEGIVSSYDGITQKYGVYCPSDEETVFVSLDDEDLEVFD